MPKKDTRMTQKQINRLLANNPSNKKENTIDKSEEEKPEVQAPSKKNITIRGTEKEYDLLNAEKSIKDFCAFIRSVIQRYEHNIASMEEAEAQETDISHYIELKEDLSREEQAVLYDKLAETLRIRRACKTENEILQPFYAYVNDKALLNKLSQIQGSVSSVKTTIMNRAYSCRTGILDEFCQEEKN